MVNHWEFDVLSDPVLIGSAKTRNRIVRAGTAETMADEHGRVTQDLVELYRSLSVGQVGLLITGHMFVSASGRAAPRQLGIDSDDHIEGLRLLTQSVHELDVPIFAQLSHAGSQSRIEALQPVAPSPVPNPLTGRLPTELSTEQIQEIIRQFAMAAQRAVLAGFDGIHIHGANGYLISQFCSPITNLRTDHWGGSVARRDNFALAVVEAVRELVPRSYPVTFKLGFADCLDHGVTAEESLSRARNLEQVGVDALEISCGLMKEPADSARRFVGISRWEALRDALVLPRSSAGPEAEATFRQAGLAIREIVDIPVILSGGIRSTNVMRDLIADGAADLLGLARPLIREPHLVSSIAEGSSSRATCTSCNLCLDHSGTDPLRCWRYPRRRLAAHYVSRLRRKASSKSGYFLRALLRF